MIPKIIHYCWLSNDPMPELMRQCIASWHRHLPEFEIRHWKIDSLDYNAIPFTRDALAAKKWAFVSDYVRLYALYHYGGIYLDTDVRVFGKIDSLLESRFFSGYEIRDREHLQIYMEGAVMGSEPGHPFIKEFLTFYENRTFLDSQGHPDLTPIPTILSDILEKNYGWLREDKEQRLADGITIYATDIVANTKCKRKRSVKLYHFNKLSWKPQGPRERFLRSLRRLSRIFRF